MDVYADPLDAIWVEAAALLGFRVVRSDAAYAAYDGRGTLTIAEAASFDPDDSLAQMIFHEICHALVAGEGALEKPDWGLDNTGSRDLVLEHACNRLQAALAGRFGLRRFLAVTTEHRAYYDALPSDPLAASSDPAVPMARRGALLSRESPWKQVLDTALEASAEVTAAARGAVSATSLFRRAPKRHSTGFFEHDDADLRCGTCAWAYASGTRLRCRQSRRGLRPGAVVDADARACARWENALASDACASCGACCREGYDLVQVGPREHLLRRHPELIAHDTLGPHVPRPGGCCAALTGDGSATPYRCRIYADRPRACRAFAVGGDACLTARRRVGLSA
jgi:hypothetical protein